MARCMRLCIVALILAVGKKVSAFRLDSASMVLVARFSSF